MPRMNRVRSEASANRGLFIRVNPSARVEIHLFASRVTPSSHVPDGGGLWDWGPGFSGFALRPHDSSPALLLVGAAQSRLVDGFRPDPQLPLELPFTAPQHLHPQVRQAIAGATGLRESPASYKATKAATSRFTG